MSEPRRHRFWQIHLSTALVLMFVAGGLIWANMAPAIRQPGNRPYVKQLIRGWPFPWHKQSINALDDNEQKPELNWAMLLFDSAFGIAQLALITIILEAIARRKEPDSAAYDRRRRAALYSIVIMTFEVWVIGNVYLLAYWRTLPTVLRVMASVADSTFLILLLFCAAFGGLYFLERGKKVRA